jgi:formylglycine-generating enzyme
MQIFLSYSRVDKPFVERFAQRLKRIFRDYTIWYDDDLLGGDIWWEEILTQIAVADIFIYLLSNESVNSPYCQAEFEEARRLQKHIITVQVRDKTRLSDELGDIQYVDMKAGMDDAEAQANLIAAINKQVKLVPKRRPKPLHKEITQRPKTAQEETRLNPQDVQTATLHDKHPTVLPKPSSYVGQITIGLIVTIVGGIVLALVLNFLRPEANTGATPIPTTEVAPVPSATPTLTETPVFTPSLVPPTPTATLTPTPLPSPIPTATLTNGRLFEDDFEASELVEWDNQKAIGRIVTEGSNRILRLENNSEEFVIFSLPTRKWEDYALEASVRIERSSLSNTDVFLNIRENSTGSYAGLLDVEPSVTGLFEVFNGDFIDLGSKAINIPMNDWVKMRVQAVGNQIALYINDEPILGVTNSDHSSGGISITVAPGTIVEIDNLRVINVGVEAALARAYDFSGTDNSDWLPFEHAFEDGVPMVLVPVGCFMMGSQDGSDDENPVHEQCFDAPFWIDKYEVRNSQFNQLNGIAERESNWTEDGAPRENITWTEAHDFCAKRGGRLPTEREWEYASRGIASQNYPWGNDFVADYVVYGVNSRHKTFPVGTRLAGIAWIGALDMSGNVWEWVSSAYMAYPYSIDSENAVTPYRVFRGGSWDFNSLYLRSAKRRSNSPDTKSSDLGFRCARDVEDGSN